MTDVVYRAQIYSYNFPFTHDVATAAACKISSYLGKLTSANGIFYGY